MSEIRLDRLHEQYVLIAPERLHRPDYHRAELDAAQSHRPCPFCEGNETLTPPEIFALRQNDPDTPGWQTRVVPNLYKAVQVEEELASQRRGMFEQVSGVGAHEVLIDSPHHAQGFAERTPEEVGRWLRTILRRCADLRNDTRLVHLSVFKNSGGNAGATQPHPHTQLIALPVVPFAERAYFEKDFEYYHRHGRGQVEDIVESERKEAVRVIEEIGAFMAFCPFASSYPFEVMIMPRRPLLCLDSCRRDDIDDLARLLHTVFVRMKRQLGLFDYNLVFRLPPLNRHFDNAAFFDELQHFSRFTLRIMPRIYRHGGFELATATMINPVSPEEAAALLRGGPAS